MDSVRGACSVDKILGMVMVREDVTPSTLEWKAIDQTRTISIPLNSLKNLQATKDGSPKMILKVIYGDDDKLIKLTFNNRPTMDNIKDSLQTIVARGRTVIKDITPASTPTPNTPSSQTSTPPVEASSSNIHSLSDANLLKNLQLQQKLLLEDRNLRNIFTQSVMNFKLSPAVFWSSRLNQLRTYALTISQHRGPYNVLSTIKPVATSDNQVNVNVTRDTINEIFDTYPIIKKAFKDLVPQKFNEGEFWSRFFNSKLFRRLRGDKINNSTNRGDVILDKYLYIDQDYDEADEKDIPSDLSELKKDDVEPKKMGKKAAGDARMTASILEENQGEQIKSLLGTRDYKEEVRVSKFIDILGNEEDNSQRLGNRADMTMRFNDSDKAENAPATRGNASPNSTTTAPTTTGQENEMIILMKNMNKLSSKMVSMSDNKSTKVLGNDYQLELDLHDLNEIEDLEFIKLDIESESQKKRRKSVVISEDAFTDEIDNSYKLSNESSGANNAPSESIPSLSLSSFYEKCKFHPLPGGIDLTQTYSKNRDEIEKSTMQTNMIIRQNFRTFRLISKDLASDEFLSNLVPESIIQEIITYNMTVVEFLSHFWKICLRENNPTQLKRIFTSLKNCRNDINAFKERASSTFRQIELVKTNEKLLDKISKDFQNCLSPMEVALDKAITEYSTAVKNDQEVINENGKRPHETSLPQHNVLS